MNVQAVTHPGIDSLRRFVAMMLTAFLLPACERKEDQGFSATFARQAEAYRELNSLLEKVIAEKSASGLEEKISRQAEKIGKLKEELLQSAPPQGEEMDRFLTSPLSAEFEETVKENERLIRRIQAEGLGSESLTQAFREIAKTPL
ncbi:MAG: hypothetical protein ACQKBY_06565 [Verrucomicrobiales bacterium]